MTSQAGAQRPSDMRLLSEANVLLTGDIDQSRLDHVIEALRGLRGSGAEAIVEINTLGGDADIGRRIALELRLFGRQSGNRVFAVGKTAVYSAGVTILAAVPRGNRFLTEDAVLLVHERHQEKSLSLNGPMKACVQVVREELSTLEQGLELERQSFAEFVAGSAVTLETLFERAKSNWYIPAPEARDLKLVAGIVG